MEIFDRNDNKYFEWMNNHSSGFVVNTLRAQNSKYFLLHKSKCYHITNMNGRTEGAFTERNYIKLCSDDINELKSWFITNNLRFPGNFDECRTCSPLVSQSPIKKNICLFPETIDDDKNEYYEGAKIQVLVNSYERNLHARSKCLDFYGYSCSVCQINFEMTYGIIGKEFIHVHHLKEISEIGNEYVIKPIHDLRPICPNCHSMIHQKKPCYTLKELTEIYLNMRNNSDHNDIV